MSIGGHSLHKKDYLTLAALGAGMTAPMWAPAMGGLLGMGGSAGSTAADAMGIGLGAAPGESAVGIADALATTPGGAAAINPLSRLSALRQAQGLLSLAQGPQQAQVAVNSPRQQMPQDTNGGLDFIRRIYGGMNG